jgi:hypothetical protein
MLTLHVFQPNGVQLHCLQPTPFTVWLNPTAAQASALPPDQAQAPHVVLISRGQALAPALAFMAALPGPVQGVANAVLAPHGNGQVQTLGIGGSLTMFNNAVTLTMVASPAPSLMPNPLAPQTPHYGGPACGFMVQVAGHKVYLAAETSMSGELRFIGDFYKPTISVVAVAPQEGIDLTCLHRALSWLGSDMIVPWPVAPQTDAEELRELIDAYSTGFGKWLTPGDSWQLPEALSSGRSSGPESRY